MGYLWSEWTKDKGKLLETLLLCMASGLLLRAHDADSYGKPGHLTGN